MSILRHSINHIWGREIQNETAWVIIFFSFPWRIVLFTTAKLGVRSFKYPCASLDRSRERGCPLFWNYNFLFRPFKGTLIFLSVVCRGDQRHLIWRPLNQREGFNWNKNRDGTQANSSAQVYILMSFGCITRVLPQGFQNGIETIEVPPIRFLTLVEKEV